MNDGKEPPVKSLLMLPNDLVLNCLARIPRLFYRTLYFVSKRFRFLLASKELYQTRTLLGRTESCLYMCLQLRTDSDLLRWFVLRQRPNSSRKFLVPVSPPNSNYASLSVVAVVGPSIYAIGGKSENKPSSTVMVMDCVSHTWREAPRMQVARVSPSTCVLDGKIYVYGGCQNLDSTNWMEVFDTETQTWEFLRIPNEEICIGSKYKILRYEGTIYGRSEAKHVTYKLHKGKWGAADITFSTIWGRFRPACCVIDNVFYYFRKTKILWYDPKTRICTTLKGLEGFPMLYLRCHNVKLAEHGGKLAEHGGKLAVLWEKYAFGNGKKIWCAEIAIEKHSNGEIWGQLEWFDNVFTSKGPQCSVSLVHALTSTGW